MIEHWTILNLAASGLSPIAQLAAPGVDTPEEAALIFSGPQFFIALLSGLILTFGFQLLLTNLSVAAGISYVGHSSSSDDSGGVGARKIGIAFGLWTLITVSLALFFACLLAVKLSLYNSALLGAITGLVIWGTYFCLLFWVSSTTVGSLIGSVVRTATASFQTLVGTATAALGAKVASNQTIQTAEAAAAAIRQELTAAWDGSDVTESLQDYLNSLRSPELDTAAMEAEFEQLLTESGLDQESRSLLDSVDRQVFVELLQDRTELSRREINRLADRLHRRWQGALSQGETLASLREYLRSASPEQLRSKQLAQKLERLDRQEKSFLSQSLSQGLNTLMGMVVGRVDLSDADVGHVRKQLQETASSLLGSGADDATAIQDAAGHNSTIRTDVESYLLGSYAWQLAPERLEREFSQVLYDPAADSRILIQELHRLNLGYFKDVLASSGLLTQKEIEETSLRLETVRQQVLSEVTAKYRMESTKGLILKVDTFLGYTPKQELLENSAMADDALRALLQDDSVDVAELEERFSQFGHGYFYQRLRQRSDIDDGEANQIAARLDGVMQKVLADAKGLQSALEVRASQQWRQLEDYLRNTGRHELNPEGIKADLRQLLRNPAAGSQRLRQRFSQFDQETIVQLLKGREDLSEEDIRQITQSVEATWYEALNLPETLTADAKAKYEQANQTITDYLRSTGKPELNPEGIRRDLELLLNDPKTGVDALRDRLASMDRDTLVQLLSQRDDLSAAEVDRVIDDMLETIQQLLRLPRRLALRTQQQARSFQESLEDYLRSTDKAALNPEGIKRDLQLLINDPRLGSERLQTRLSYIDRDAVVSLLAQRDDISREEANSAVDQILAVRDQLLARVQQAQERFQKLFRSLLQRVRRYLDSLERPELDYYGIKRDLRQLFDDPQAGFSALQQRLSQVDRNTIVAIMSSHDAVSESDARQLIVQVEEARDSALRKAEQLENQVQSRLSELKQQAQQQVDDTRKTAEAASWWLFGTATVSAITAAIAGTIAVGG